MAGSNTHSSTVVNTKQHEDITNIMKAGGTLDNTYGRHNIKAGDTGKGVTIYLQNLQDTKMQLQQLGANAVYVPESNSLVLLSWAPVMWFALEILQIQKDAWILVEGHSHGVIKGFQLNWAILNGPQHSLWSNNLIKIFNIFAPNKTCIPLHLINDYYYII